MFILWSAFLTLKAALPIHEETRSKTAQQEVQMIPYSYSVSVLQTKRWNKKVVLKVLEGSSGRGGRDGSRRWGGNSVHCHKKGLLQSLPLFIFIITLQTATRKENH